MSLLAQLVIALAIFAAGAAGGIKWQIGVVAARDLKTVQDNARALVRRVDQVDKASAGHETFRAAASAREVIVEKEVERVVEKPVYRNMCLDDDGLRIIAADIAARTPGGQPAPAVPPAAEPGPAGWQERAAVDSPGRGPVQRVRGPARPDG